MMFSSQNSTTPDIKQSEVRTPAVWSVSAERNLKCNHTCTSLYVFCDATVEHVCSRAAFSPLGTGWQPVSN